MKIPEGLKVGFRSGSGRRRLPYVLAGCVVLLPFLLLVPSVFPCSDDYADFRFVREFGFGEAIRKYYMEWGGRYFSVLLVYMFNTIGAADFFPYRLLVVVSLLMLATLCYQLSLIFQRITGSGGNTLPVFLIFLITITGYLPGMVEIVYWFTGSWVYLPGLLLIAGWVLLASGRNPPGKWRLALLLLLPLCIAGTNELNILLFAGVWLLTYLAMPPVRKYLLMAALPFMAGAGVALFAPGNQIRQDFFLLEAGNPSGDLVFSIRQMAGTFWHFGRDWLRSTPLIIAGILLYQYAGNSKTPGQGDKKTALLLLTGLLAVTSLTFPFFWGTGRTVAAIRVMNIYWIAFSFFTFCLTVVLMKRFESKTPSQPVVTAALFISLTCFFSYRSNWRSAFDDLRMAGKYRAQMEERIAMAGKAEKTDTLKFAPLSVRPATIVYIDLNKDPEHWFNRGFAYRYGIAAVEVLPDTTKH